MKRTFQAALAASMLVATLFASAGSAQAGTARCDEGHWPATVQGKPATLHAGGVAGYYIWHDKYGWHLRTTTPQHKAHAFTGKIVSSSTMGAVRQFRDEGRDTIRVSGHELGFAFTTWNGIDGVDFRVGCTESVTFLLKVGGRYIDDERVFLGEHGTAPSNPFTVNRTH